MKKRRKNFGADLRQAQASGDGPAIPFGDCVCGTVSISLLYMYNFRVATLLIDKINNYIKLSEKGPKTTL